MLEQKASEKEVAGKTLDILQADVWELQETWAQNIRLFQITTRESDTQKSPKTKNRPVFRLLGITGANK